MSIVLWQSKPNFEVWFGSDVVQVLLLKGAFPIMDATVRQIMGSAVGFEDSATGLTLSIGKVCTVFSCALAWFVSEFSYPLTLLQAIVRDLRPGAPFPVVFDVWHEKAMTMGANSVMQIGMASMPDLSTSGINTGLDAALLATLVQSSTVPPISPTPTAFSDVATPALQSRPPLLRAVSRPDLLSSEGDPSNRVTEALRRIECGLHVDGDVDRHGVVNMGIPLDAPDTWAIVMQGVDLDVTSWESAGSPLAAASLWGATSGFYAAEASGPQRTSVDVLGESMGKPDSGPSNSDGSPPIPLLHIQVMPTPFTHVEWSRLSSTSFSHSHTLQYCAAHFSLVTVP